MFRLAAFLMAMVFFSSVQAQQPPQPFNVMTTACGTNAKAVGDGSTNDTPAIQCALNTYNSVYLPAPSRCYLVNAPIVMHSYNHLFGQGYASEICSSVSTRVSGIIATGTASQHLTDIRVSGIFLSGLAVWSGGAVSVTNGGGINFQFVDSSRIDNNVVQGWSDAGISVTDGSQNLVFQNQVSNTAQSIQFFASAGNTTGNMLIANVSNGTGDYNAFDVEGATGGGSGKNLDTLIINNSANNSYGIGVNVEVSPNATVVGNLIVNSGLGQSNSSWASQHPNYDSGIELLGAYNSVVSYNQVRNSAGYGIFVGGNAGQVQLDGNATQSNTSGSVYVTDYTGPGAGSYTYDVMLGVNTLNEGSVQSGPGVSFINNRCLYQGQALFLGQSGSPFTCTSMTGTTYTTPFYWQFVQ